MEWLALLLGIYWAVRAIIFFASWQPFISSIVLTLLVWLAWLFYRDWGRKNRELLRQGFHVEWVSPGVVRAGPDDIAIVYHDPRGEISFEGKEVGRNAVVHIPASSAWKLKVPDWAKDQRHIIIERICKANKRIIIADD